MVPSRGSLPAAAGQTVPVSGRACTGTVARSLPACASNCKLLQGGGLACLHDHYPTDLPGLCNSFSLAELLASYAVLCRAIDPPICTRCIASLLASLQSDPQLTLCCAALRCAVFCRSLDPPIFNGLAHEAVLAATAAVQDAARLLAKVGRGEAGIGWLGVAGWGWLVGGLAGWGLAGWGWLVGGGWFGDWLVGDWLVGGGWFGLAGALHLQADYIAVATHLFCLPGIHCCSSSDQGRHRLSALLHPLTCSCLPPPHSLNCRPRAPPTPSSSPSASCWRCGRPSRPSRPTLRWWSGTWVSFCCNFCELACQIKRHKTYFAVVERGLGEECTCSCLH